MLLGKIFKHIAYSQKIKSLEDERDQIIHRLTELENGQKEQKKIQAKVTKAKQEYSWEDYCKDKDECE